MKPELYMKHVYMIQSRMRFCDVEYFRFAILRHKSPFFIIADTTSFTNNAQLPYCRPHKRHIKAKHQDKNETTLNGNIGSVSNRNPKVNAIAIETHHSKTMNEGFRVYQYVVDNLF